MCIDVSKVIRSIFGLFKILNWTVFYLYRLKETFNCLEIDTILIYSKSCHQIRIGSIRIWLAPELTGVNWRTPLSVKLLFAASISKNHRDLRLNFSSLDFFHSGDLFLKVLRVCAFSSLFVSIDGERVFVSDWCSFASSSVYFFVVSIFVSVFLMTLCVSRFEALSRLRMSFIFNGVCGRSILRKFNFVRC